MGLISVLMKPSLAEARREKGRGKEKRVRRSTRWPGESEKCGWVTKKK